MKDTHKLLLAVSLLRQAAGVLSHSGMPAMSMMVSKIVSDIELAIKKEKSLELYK